MRPTPPDAIESLLESGVDRGLIEQLADFSFTEVAQNVVFVGGTGTGKRHLAGGAWRIRYR